MIENMLDIEKDSNDLSNQSFNIQQKHLDYILSINDNKSLALRQILDRNIETDRQKEKQVINEFLDKTIILCSFGFIAIMISYLLTSIVQAMCITLGVFLITYSIIGGVINAVRFSKKH